MSQNLVPSAEWELSVLKDRGGGARGPVGLAPLMPPPLMVGQPRQGSEVLRGALKGPAPDQWPADSVGPVSKREKAPEAWDKGKAPHRLCEHQEGKPRSRGERGQPWGSQQLGTDLWGPDAGLLRATRQPEPDP